VTIVTTCRVCGKPIEVDREQIVAGDWRTCADCKKPKEAR
jgi:RNA polymerase-binding transcription factor DksA